MRLVIAALLSLFAITAASALSEQEALDALVAAYPRHLKGHDGRTLIWRDGTRTPAGDGKPDKPFDDALRNASIADQFRIPYPRGATAAPALNEDPGRFRNTAFFRKMYGQCDKGEVTRQMVAITWLPKSWGKTVMVTSVNGVAKRLIAVSHEIEKLPAHIRRAAYPIAGVYSCRPVADTGQWSVHAYGAAIDLNLEMSDYWFWQKEKTDPIAYRNRMPREIVDIFERHGFIWGGRWYHYDTMHFEYRPELLGMKAD